MEMFRVVQRGENQVVWGRWSKGGIKDQLTKENPGQHLQNYSAHLESNIYILRVCLTPSLGTWPVSGPLDLTQVYSIFSFFFSLKDRDLNM